MGKVVVTMSHSYTNRTSNSLLTEISGVIIKEIIAELDGNKEELAKLTDREKTLKKCYYQLERRPIR